MPPCGAWARYPSPKSFARQSGDYPGVARERKLRSAVILATRRLHLHPLPAGTAGLLADDPPAAVPYLPATPAPGWPSAEFLEVLPGYAEAAGADPSLIGWGAWLLVLRDRPALIGDAGFHAPPDEHGEVEVAYSLAPAYRGRGYATEAVAALVDRAFADPRVAAAVATTAAGNAPSARVLKRCGFVAVEDDGAFVRWRRARGR